MHTWQRKKQLWVEIQWLYLQIRARGTWIQWWCVRLQIGHCALSGVRRHLQLSTPGEAVEARPLEGICALIVRCPSRTALVSLQTPSNVPGTAALLKE